MDMTTDFPGMESRDPSVSDTVVELRSIP